MASAKTKAQSKKRPDGDAPVAAAVKPTDLRALERRSEWIGLIIVGAAGLFGAALWSYSQADMDLIHAGQGSSELIVNYVGPVGARVADLLLQLLGLGAWGLAVLLLVMGLRTLIGRHVLPGVLTIAGLLGMGLSSAILLHLAASAAAFRPWGKDAAGLVGSALAEVLRAFLSTAGSAIVGSMLLVGALSALTGRPLMRLAVAWLWRWLRHGGGLAAERSKSAAKQRFSAWRHNRQEARAQAVAAAEAASADLAAAEIEHQAWAELTPAKVDMPAVFQEMEDDFAADTIPDPPALMPATRVLATSSTEIPQLSIGPDGFPTGTAIAPPDDIVPTAVRMARQQEAAEHTRRQGKRQPSEDGLAEEQMAVDEIAAAKIVDQETAGAPATTQESKHADANGADQTTGAEQAPPAIPAEDEAGAATEGAPNDLAHVGPRIVETAALKEAFSVEDEAIDIEAIDGVDGHSPSKGPKQWRLPPADLVQRPPDRRIDCDASVLRDNAAVLEQKLADFKITGEVTDIRPGPVVTTYEYKPAAGVKISRITNVRDDLTMSLAALRVRVVAPIPGRDVVGIEVPNKHRQIVYFRELLGSAAWRDAESPVTLVLGKDIEGRPVVTDLAKAPHLLVAGATGTGKSVGINSFLCSMLFKATPDEVRVLLIDPKVIELAVYEDIPHLLLPVISEMDKAALALKWAVREMERRYKLLATARVRNLAGYNEKVPEMKAAHKNMRVRVVAGRKQLVPADSPGAELLEPPADHNLLPRIVVVIDEFADLIMQCGKEVEISVARLAQKARAAGIHVILATQRPSTDVLTGMIKANFPTRVSFQVASAIDSKVVINGSGAESLLGNGDMLFLPPGTSSVRRCHGTWITDDEVVAIARHWRDQGRPDYDMDILTDPDADTPSAVQDDDLDPLFEDAVQIAIEAEQASVSFLQRKLNIGYGRAARIVDHMESRGIVGPQRGPNKPREILATGA